MVKSGPQKGIDRLEKLHERAIKIIDNNCHRKLSLNDLMRMYNIQPISQRQDEHLCSLMYRLSKKNHYVKPCKTKGTFKVSP